jgi:hypothetical protein
MGLRHGGSSLQRLPRLKLRTICLRKLDNKKSPFSIKATSTKRATLADGMGITLRRGI